MGVVYEAQQISLDRRVALKVLPFAAALDGRQLQRFKNEAQAAAQLHHTHIVPVYGVGTERGVHYYAMQFIEGQTLATLIRDLRRSEGRETAGETDPAGLRAGSVPAGALGAKDTSTTGSYPLAPFVPAYRQGVGLLAARTADTAPQAPPATPYSARGPAYFRTVANLALQAAEGLEHAHQLGIIHRDVKPSNLLLDGQGQLWVTDFGLAHCQSQPGLTMTGDLLGTLRYMSPEQTLAQRVAVDHRTDVYSLGVTLYELLTFEPAVPGGDRHEILRQIAFEEPRPPRRLHKAIPAELEIIAGKAMEKRPEDRYGTAGELAEDLHRFLADKPLLARPPTLRQRCSRWCRRHRPVVTAGLVALLTASAFSLVGSVQLWSAYRAETAAYEAAADQSERLRANLATALQVLDEIYLQVAEVRLPRDGPADLAADRALLEKALRFYERFARENRARPGVQREVARAYWRVANIDLLLVRLERAREGYLRARELSGRLAEEAPDDPDLQYELASVDHGLAEVARTQGHWKEAMRCFRRSVAVFGRLAARHPTHPRYRAATANSRESFGEVCWRVGHLGQAEEHFRRAIALRTELVGEDDGARRNVYNRQRLGDTFTYLGATLRDRGANPEEADSHFGAARRLNDQLLESNPQDPVAWRNLGWAYGHWGELRMQRRKPKEAERFLWRAVDCYHKAITLHPNVLYYQAELAWVHSSLADLLNEQKRLPAARAHLDKASELVTKARTVYGAEPLYHEELARIHVRLAETWTAAVDRRRAEESYARALGHFDIFVRRMPGHFVEGEGLAETCFALGSWLIRSGRSAEAKKLCRQVLARAPGCPALDNALARRLVMCPDPELRNTHEALLRARRAVAAIPGEANSWAVLGAAYYRARNWERALTSLERALAVSKGGDSGEWFLLAMANWQRGEKKQARRWYARAVQDMNEHQVRFVGDEELRRLRAEAAALLGEQVPSM
jgi:serine/threonine protein kinase/Tfp pilus assembly protein PilF